MIETVPNISEGRSRDTIDRLISAASRAATVTLADVSVDPSHHRSVFTLLGPGDALVDTLLEMYAIAVERIDLRRHHGVHPRIGAVDVVPFVPIADASMDECIVLAKRLAESVSTRFGIPVYLYEYAATRPERRRLERIRHGQFEGLARKMRQPDWTPDYGPAQPHPSAGATAIGARRVLIAFNVNLNSTDVRVARAIAQAIRERDGGLPAVKAIGVSLADRRLTQVAINLVDATVTPLHTVVQRVVDEAAARGVDVLGSELIGLLPSTALLAAAASSLHLDRLTTDRVLDVRPSRPAHQQSSVEK